MLKYFILFKCLTIFCIDFFQFNYGEDGLDICKTGFLKQKQFPLLLENKHILESKQGGNKEMEFDKKVKKWQKRVCTRTGKDIVF